jgi:tRNA pseudouridine38-40 synthase
MQKEACALLGTHDFAAFAASGSVVRDTVRTIWRADVTRSGNDVTLIIEGNGFLYNMVRIIAGTLIEVGLGRREIDTVRRAVLEGDRTDAGPTAPAKGLTLKRILYDTDQ